METLTVFADSHCCFGYFPLYSRLLPNHHSWTISSHFTLYKCCN